ncbi:MAG: M13 family metallopeptidase, partial [Acidobacteria bacterium]|nr:M13 family metallopeptidase [Acidobacteriota bacterium]
MSSHPPNRLAPVVVACAALTLAGFVACAPKPPAAPTPAPDALDVAEVAKTISNAMDTSADPCQDFYRYACGGWVDSTELPSDQARWTRVGSVLQEKNKEALHDLLEAPAADTQGAAPAAAEEGGQLSRVFYGSCMDEAAVKAAGMAPLQPWLEQIDRAEDLGALLQLAGELHRRGIGSFLESGVLPDFDDPTVYAFLYMQGGLGLPERDYYLRDDDASQELLDAYRAHVAKMLDLLGGVTDEDVSAASEAEATRIVDFETELAKVSRPVAELRDIERWNNKLSLAELHQLAPKMPWEQLWQGAGFNPPETVTVAVPEFFKGLSKILADTELATLRSYLRWQLIHGTAELLTPEVVAENFAFYGHRLAGQQENQVRWKRCVTATDEAVGEDLGKLYVAKYFAGDSKKVAVDMIRGIESAFEANLPQLSWMDETTRQRALEKAEAIANKIGYPDKWRDYSALELVPGSYFTNALAAQEFEYDRQHKRVGQPVDRSEWGMTPPTVNAYYNPLLNEMVFPAGILQPPVFHRDFPMALNFGGIGAVMGHELTHGFDDSGRKFDAQGLLREWWEPEVGERFDERAACVRDL